MIALIAAILVAFMPVPSGLAPSSLAGPAPIAPDAALGLRGTASHVGYGYGRLYLALPEHRWGRPGIRVRICGAGGCIDRTSTDAGPSLAMQRAGRIADLNAWDFETVCGIPASRGLCTVTVTYGLDSGGVGPRPTVPPTDTQP